MYLKSLELMGFKSFARKTVFQFGPGVTAIVGPNGSGKSNVGDAIRWVLGEQSAKLLRGTSMREVIFAGTPLVRSASFAQVKLVLDNEDRRLPLDFTEVSIGRELYRSGESNYYVNAEKTLLGNLRELLMDTGIGQEGYSVIGQGVVDDIIYQRLQNRRSLIEEAAGVHKFKHRKAAALGKLDQTEANITRVRDIIREIEGQLGPLAEQATKAREYQDLTNRIRQLEIELLLFDLTQLYQERDNLGSMKSGLLAKVAEVQAFIDDLKARKGGIHQELAQFETSINEVKGALGTAGASLEAARREAYRVKEEIREQETRHELVIADLADLDHRLAEGGEEITHLDQAMNGLVAAAETAAGEVKTVTAGETAAREALDQHLQKVARHKDSTFQVAVSLSNGRNRLNTLQQQMDLIDRQLARGGSEHEELGRELEKLTAEHERVGNELTTFGAELAQEMTALDRDRAEAAQLDRQVKRLEEQTTALADQVRITHARRNLLEEVAQRAEGGLNRGVRELQALREQRLPGICGIVGDLITVPRGQELAFETALGGSIQDLIVRDSATAEAGIQLLKQNKWGRVTFLPLDMIRPAPRCEAPRVAGCLGVALDLVQYDAKYYQAMVHLLGRVLIFDRLEPAVAFARQNRDFNRIVTLEGEVVRSSGAMTGGSEANRGAGLLTRRRELEDLIAKAGKLEAEERSARSQLGTWRTRRDQLTVSVREREDKLVRRRQSLDFLAARREQLDRTLAEKRALFAQIDGERQELVSQRQVLETERSTVHGELAELERENAALAKRQAAHAGEEETLRQALVAAQQALSDARVKEAQVAEQVKAAKRELDSARKRQREATDRRQAALDERARIETQRSVLQADLEARNRTAVELETGLQRLTAELEGLSERYRRVAQSIESLDRQHQSRLKMEESARAKIAEIEIKLAQINTHCQTKESTLVTEYGFDLTEGLGALRRIDNREALATQLTDARGQRQALEPVNLLAIDEYERTRERHQFLTTQIQDLCDAAESLRKVIAEIERISIERYRETFASVAKAFAEIFLVLFPGGRAEIKIADPEKPLESNVEIHCQMPGKKLMPLELTSGGEKALISLALLFAILQVKPPAFCLLDEVEAALDEANVRRFTRLLRNFADKTQFLVITHNKETMQAVDTIYGITLEKSGISRPISIRLEEADNIREFPLRERLAKTA